MPYRVDVDDSASVIDGVDHAVIAHSDSPQILGPLELSASRGTAIRSQKFNAAKHPGTQRLAEPLQLLAGAPGEGDVVRHRYRLRLTRRRRLTLSRDSRGSFDRDLATATS